MEQWLAWGFPFSAGDQAMAVESADFPDPSILNVSVESNENKVLGAYQQFQVVVTTNGSILSSETTIQIEIDSNIFVGTYQYKTGPLNTTSYHLGASVVIPAPYTSYIYVLKASIVSVRNLDRDKVLSEKLINIEVNSNGSVVTTNKQIIKPALKLDSENLSVDLMSKIFDDATKDVVREVTDAFNEGMSFFKIDNCLRKAHFFAQCLSEVSPKFIVQQPESLNYPAQGLIDGYWYSRGTDWVKGDLATGKGGYYKDGKKNISQYSYFQKHKDIADRYGRKDLDAYNDKKIQIANEIMLANYVYGHSEGLGNGGPETGDGSKFRGKGVIQLTGRYNYEQVNNQLKLFDKNLDILSDPDILLHDIRLAVLSAMAFWKWKKINEVIKTDKSSKIVDKVTDITNYNLKSDARAIRIKNFINITSVDFNVSDCKL